jgi:two-component system sensor histidine kinase/response regulator
MDFDNLALLQAVFDSTAEGILVVDNSGKIIQFNKRFQELWKIPLEILNTHDDEKVLGFILQQLSDPTSFIAKVKELYMDPDASSHDQIEFNDGRHFERFSRPLKMGELTVGRLWNFRDMTQMKKNEQVLAAITELSPDIISIVDANGTLVYNSTAAKRIHGYDNEEMIGNNTLDLIHQEDRAYVSQELTDLLKKPGGLTTVQYRYHNKDGSYSWMEATAFNLVKNPLIRGVVTISRKIEERKQLEMDLKDALSLRDDFLSIASHELKTPLTSIKLQLQMMIRAQTLKLENSGLRSGNMDNLLEQISSLQHLIEDLLSVSKIRTGNLALTLAEEDLSHCVDKLISTYKNLFLEANCILETDIENNIKMNFDKQKVEQVLVNLMSNAIKYAPGSKVKIELKQNKGHAELRVQDLGPGIPAENHEMIFARFSRASSSSYTSGLGIGLFISKNIVEGHKGSIHVESQPGSGTTFIVKLPLQFA